MSFVEVGGVVLHAERRGDPDKPLVVLANSLGTDARIWDAVLPTLLTGHSVLLYDKRGHGLSELPPGPATIADHAKDCLALVDAFGVQRFAFVGVSVGGMIGQAVAARAGERVAALVLCDTAACIGDAAGWNARIAAIESGGIASIADAILARWFTPAYREREGVAMRGWHTMLTRQPAQGYAALCAAIRDADLAGEAARIAVPTLCVAGEEDLSTPPDLVRGTAALIPGARFATIPGAGHLPCIDQPATLAALIRRHLTDAGF